MATRVTSSKAKGGASRTGSGRQSGASRSTGKKNAQNPPPRKEEPGSPPAPPKVPLSLIEPKTKIKKSATDKAPKLRPFLDSIGKSNASSKPSEPPPAEKPQTPEAAVSASPEKSEPSPSPEKVSASSEEAATAPKTIHIKPPIVVRDLAQQLGLKPFQMIHDLMELNIFAAINQTIEPDIAGKLCEKHGFHFEREKRKSGEGHHKLETPVVAPPPPPIEKVAEELVSRAPIITFMGHVDHGKTSLLDAIRKTKVTAGEAGGITQHVGAYSVERNGKQITFLDTPGHAAFTAMRARGANVTDIVVLVVAADDGLMPQTIEAINHAKAAKVTIMVAINKMDLPSANIDRVKQQLQEKGLTPEDWGGETICIPVSATQGTGIEELLDMMLLQAEMLELKASKRTPARCTVIEAQLEPGRGPTATIIVRMGTLQIGRPFICGNHWGKVKQLIDDSGRAIREAGPATPVRVLGLSGLPNAGDELVVMDSERSARTLSEEKLDAIRTHKLSAPQRTTLENLFQNIANEQKKSLQIILKADVQGSMEALIAALKEIPSQKIFLEIIHAAVGPISESDVLLASASNAVIIGFNIKVENTASGIAKREGIQIKLYSIIYELIDQVKEAMAGMLDPQLRETVIGHAEVKQVFTLSKGKVAGCIVQDGRIARTARARLLRKRQPIYDGGLATLRRFQDDVKDVRAGLECGIRLGDFSEYQPEDIIECYTLDKVPQSLE